jgi:hypothetical protein
LTDSFTFIETLIICALLLATLIYSIWMCASDARRRGKSPLLVAALVILFFPLGLIVWLLVRPPISERPKPFRLDDHRLQ